MANFQINISKVKEDILKRVSRNILPRVILDATPILKAGLVPLFLETINNTTVFKALRGEFDGDELYDVPAHLGLSTSSSYSAAQNIMESIENILLSQQVVTRTTKGRFGGTNAISFNISLENLAEQVKENTNYSEYTSISKRGEFVIPWLEWLLDGGNVDGYEIVFDDGSYDANFFKNSRSGRAVMDKGSGWSMPTNNFAIRGSNFIEEALTDSQWIINAQILIKETIEDLISSKTYTDNS